MPVEGAASANGERSFVQTNSITDELDVNDVLSRDVDMIGMDTLHLTATQTAGAGLVTIQIELIRATDETVVLETIVLPGIGIPLNRLHDGLDAANAQVRLVTPAADDVVNIYLSASA